ncbi:TPA: CatB-related O-acetyltransferase [Vibrio parahaemolyticus]|uniref:CatB-related O-acetyltransferase n=1 Tax=Vibrio parahaemolyticus TaxID=670 RepID=UPI0011229086|nr:CatB-related O-acetyltransferase [Vibrio parahaemolyticus]TOG71605.1 antibiotic acetyltransferase [Vibrio parahaemolyticus]HCE3562265.1 CatB-related O-acetyltransferase [Vibrio parahaemolyticus]HCE3564687.1 CatB-related O-acetyltransferase [Vibrio parahaemolyticus]
MTKHWSKVQYLHQVVQNANIHIKGTHSYYSDCWDNDFEQSVVRYLLGDEISKQWQPRWEVDQLYIGDYVCIAAEAVILMGGNHNHRTDWFCLYPFLDDVERSYQSRGDTIIGDAVWIGMRAMIMPGVTIGEGAPAKPIKTRFDSETIDKLLALKMYSWDEAKFNALRSFICGNDIEQLIIAESNYKGGECH